MIEDESLLQYLYLHIYIYICIYIIFVYIYIHMYILTVANHVFSSSSLSDSSSGSCPPDRSYGYGVVQVKIKDLGYHIFKHMFSLNHTIQLLGDDSYSFLRKPRKYRYQRPRNLFPPALHSAKSLAAWLAA